MEHFTCRTVADLALPGPTTGRLTILALYGDADAGSDLYSALHASGPAQLVLDLGGLHRLSPTAAETLYRFAASAAAHGRPMLLVGCPAEVAAVLARARPPGVSGHEQFPTVSEALAAVLARTLVSAAPSGARPPPLELRPHVLLLRHALLARALVGRAQGMLMERYGLRDARVAGALLWAVAREHRAAPLRLAAAIIQAPAPRPGARWFPGRGPAARPAVGFVTAPADRPLPLPVFLDALRDAGCAITHTHAAGVQLIDPSDNTLWLESSCGLPAEFVRFFAVTGDTGTCCGEAARKNERIVVDDVASSPYFDEPSRAMVLAAHSRSVQSTPVPGPAGRPQGVLSTHHERPGHVFTGTELGALDAVAREAGAWLDWYRTTTLLDALEDLHRRARAR
ncbi:GAF domain-containing protein [Streptomyces sp. AF1A]|uniref:GAF domain-containing protein n=1 Tax=Streptomyces sp. AF1A TaxID=3394350 RepID=UPI0039BD3EDB